MKKMVKGACEDINRGIRADNGAKSAKTEKNDSIMPLYCYHEENF